MPATLARSNKSYPNSRSHQRSNRSQLVLRSQLQFPVLRTSARARVRISSNPALLRARHADLVRARADVRRECFHHRRAAAKQSMEVFRRFDLHSDCKRKDQRRARVLIARTFRRIGKACQIPASQGIDKSVLAVSAPRRYRNKESSVRHPTAVPPRAPSFASVVTR